MKVRKIITMLLVLTVILSSFSIAFAADSSPNSSSTGIIESTNFTDEKVNVNQLADNDSVQALPTIMVLADRILQEWNDDYVTFDLFCEATGGKIKTYSGYCEVIDYYTGEILSYFPYTMINNSGTYYLADEYSAWVGSSDRVKIKLSDQSCIDIYGRTIYLINSSRSYSR